MKKPLQEVTLNVPADLEYIGVVQAAVDFFAAKIGFTKREMLELELAVEESFSTMLSFNNGLATDRDYFDITLSPIAMGIKIDLHDMGAPMEDEAWQTSEDMGRKIIMHVADRTSFSYRGREGRFLTLEKDLRSAMQTLSPDASMLPNDAKDAKNTKNAVRESFTIRELKDSEAIEVARCAYSAYGYSYFNDDVFIPQRLLAAIKEGRMRSLVAVNDATQVIMGHSSIALEKKGDRAAEAAASFVKQEYRGMGIFEDLCIARQKAAREMGIEKLYGKAVAAHPASQKAHLKLGMKECGLAVGSSPFHSFKGFDNDQKRGSTLYIVMRLQESAQQEAAELHIPERYASILEKIYINMGEKFKFSLSYTDPSSSCEAGDIHMVYSPSRQAAKILVGSVGKYTARQLKASYKDALRKGADYIGLFLPLADRSTPFISQVAEEEGFFFGGVAPAPDASDMLMMQYCNTEVDYEGIKLASDFAKELMEYIRQDDPAGR